jgi:hypothetical protein
MNEKIREQLLQNILADVDKTLTEEVAREKACAGWMASVIRILPSQKGYNKLPEAVRDEIEQILTAIE